MEPQADREAQPLSSLERERLRAYVYRKGKLEQPDEWDEELADLRGDVLPAEDRDESL